MQKRMQKRRKTNLEMIPIPMPGMPGTDDNVMEADFHVLISKDYPAEMNPLMDNGVQIPGLFEETPSMTLHKLFIGDFMEQGKGLVKLLNKLQEAPQTDQLEQHISSVGGSFLEVVQLHNLIDSMYSKRSASYMNYGYSGGAMAFVMTKERVIYKNSTAMFHFFAGGERGKGHDMLRSLKHAIHTIEDYYRMQLKDFFTKKELNRMIKHGKEFWMDAVEMMNRGIATGIIIEGEYFTSESYFNKYDKRGNILKKWHKANNKAIKEAEKAQKEQQEMIENYQTQGE